MRKISQNQIVASSECQRRRVVDGRLRGQDESWEFLLAWLAKTRRGNPNQILLNR